MTNMINQKELIENSTKRFEYIMKELYRVSMNDVRVFKTVRKVVAYLTDHQILSNEEFINLFNK